MDRQIIALTEMIECDRMSKLLECIGVLSREMDREREKERVERKFKDIDLFSIKKIYE